ncbi:MAG: succinate dehydrogenase, cytochrome b556 subunit [endosymbiont of Galathealinum brachiosum]|uniref:Succinate dehydrogenase cytochrome b556 subunit n=1 Tax=endosymbiont of Galathealinum brachiosum TaxID=2200906 RepID=A0A370DHW7_9GAMM|nr:MAG: succinate dehydrogenase, cytochrome b556 subunit [endosymbiont of Galathealinum brachiosum]
MAVSDNRPFFLNLVIIRLPVTGFVSIFHRISGLLLFLAIPFSVYLLDISLQGIDGFNKAVDILNMPFFQLVSLVLLWSIIHHFIAGIRFLLTDFDIGLEKQRATQLAWLVFVIEAVVLALLILGIFL